MRRGTPSALLVLAVALLGPAPFARATDGDGPTPAGDPPVRVDLVGGQRLYGGVTLLDGGGHRIDLVGGGQVVVAPGGIVRTETMQRPARLLGGRITFPSALDARYLHARSATLPGSGSGYFVQEEVALTTAVVGLGDYVAVGAGGVIPVFFSGKDGINGWALLKAGAPLGPHLRFAGEVEGVTFPFLGRLALAQLLVTYETERLSVTVGGGRELRPRDGTIDAADRVGFLAASYRLTADVALLTENWIFSDWPDWNTMNALGVRLAAHPFALDVGVFLTPFTKLPIPWFNVGMGF